VALWATAAAVVYLLATHHYVWAVLTAVGIWTCASQLTEAEESRDFEERFYGE
jgi:hypothetical protein